MPYYKPDQINISAGTTSNNLSNVTFSNSNGVSFGLNGSTITASHNALTSQSNQAFSADASSTFQTLVFQDSNGISFSNNAGNLRITHGLQFTSNTSAITSNALNTSASRVINIVLATNNTGGGTASLSSNVSFTNANGATFYSSAGGAVALSYTVPTVTNSSFSVQDSGTTINPVSRIAFSTGNNITATLSTAANHVTVGFSHNLAGTSTGFTGGASISGSMTHNSSGLAISLSHPAWITTATQSSFSVQDSATTINPVNRIAFSTGNNITLSLSTGAGSATVGVQHNLAGTSSGFTGGASISGSMTHNSSGLAISLSHPAWLTTAALAGDTTKYVQAWELTGNTAGTTSSSQGTKIYFSGGNNVTLSGNSNTIVVSVGAGGGGIAASLSGNSTSGGAGYSNITSGTMILAGGPNITLSQDGSRISISGNNPGAAAENNWHTLAGNVLSNSSASGSTIQLSGGNNITVYGTNDSQIGIRGLSFDNSNNITFGINAGTLTASFNPINIGMSTGGNTAGTTGTFDGANLQYVFAGGNNVTLSQSSNASSITLSIHGLSFANSNGISFGTNAGTLTAGVATITSYFEGLNGLTLLSAPGNGSISVERVRLDEYITGTMVALPVYQSIVSSATANTYGQVWSAWAMILTNDTVNNRLMSLSSGSTQTTFSVASNTAGVTQLNGSGVRPITIPMNVNATPGIYYFAWNWSTNTSSIGTATTALGRTISMLGRGAIMSASFGMVSAYDVATAATNNRLFPQGVVSGGASAGIPTTISHSQITMTGASVSQANLAFYIQA